MAVTCTPANLAGLATCYRSVSPTHRKAIQIRLLCAIANGETMTCDPNTLLANAACFVALSEGDKDAIITYLLCQIANGGGGGGGGGFQAVSYTVDPPANPSNTGGYAIAFDPTGILPTKFWNTGTLTWN